MHKYQVSFYDYWSRRQDIHLTVVLSNKATAIGTITKLVHDHGGFGTAAVITKIRKVAS